LSAAETFIATYGIVVVFFGTMLEGETVAIMSGFLAHQGVLDGRLVLAVATLGAFCGDQLLFFIGRRFADHPFVMRQRNRPLFARALARIEANQTGFILGFRFVYGLRTVSPLALGVSSVSARRFVILNAIAAFLWACLMTGLGFAFGRVIEAAFGELRAVEHKLIVMLAVGVVAFVALTLIHRRFRARQE